MQIVSLGDVSRSVMYGYTASSSDSPSSAKLLRTTDIVSHPVNWDSVPYCSPAPSPEDLRKFGLRKDDIVVSRMGTVGVSAFVDPPGDAVFASYLVRFQIDPAVAVPRYIAFLLRSRQWWDYVHARKGGAVQPNLNANIMKSFTFALPSLDDQRAVVNELAPIDDKIILAAREATLLSAVLDIAVDRLLQK